MAIECARCHAQNPNDKRFCGDCGGPLDPAYVAIKELMGPTLREQMREIVAAELKDQKILEVETVEAIVTKLSDWAKLLAFFVGIPVTILLLLLGLLGFRTYSDFTNLVAVAKKDVAIAQQDAVKLKTESQELIAQSAGLRKQISDTQAEVQRSVADIKSLRTQLGVVSQKVDAIGEKLGFTPSSSITSESKAQLQTAFKKFQEFLQALGYQGWSDHVVIDIPEKMTKDAFAYYDPGNQTMVIDRRYASDPDLLYHEYMHHVLIFRAPNPGDAWTYYSIEAGLANYFPCSFNNNPRLSEVTAALTGGNFPKIDLNESRSFRGLRPGMDVIMVLAEAWGGAFWEIRRALKQEIADKILFEAWFNLSPDEVRGNRGEAFVRRIIEADRGAHQAQILQIFNERGL
jgi:hypothetical protein